MWYRSCFFAGSTHGKLQYVNSAARKRYVITINDVPRNCGRIKIKTNTPNHENSFSLALDLTKYLTGKSIDFLYDLFLRGTLFEIEFVSKMNNGAVSISLKWMRKAQELMNIITNHNFGFIPSPTQP